MKAQNEENVNAINKLISSPKMNVEKHTTDQQEYIIYSPEMDISYSNLFFDIRSAID
jgi:hypothetical protein